MRAIRSTAPTCAVEGRFSTHSPVRRRFSVVLEIAASPSMQRQPSHQAEDIGARFGRPSSLIVLTRTTGVPKYRIGDLLSTCTSITSVVRGLVHYNERRAVSVRWL